MQFDDFPELNYLYENILWSYMSMYPNETNYVTRDNRSYTSNSYGHRGPEFTPGVDALIVGCSITYGIGLELEETWGHMVATELGYTYNLLGFPGGSCAKMVRQIFAYIDKIGKPKRILALLPESRRVDLYEPAADQFEAFLVNPNEVRLKLNKLEDLVYMNPHENKFLYDIDYPSLNSINAIYLLEKLCKFLNIELVWSTWHSRRFIETYKNFPSFLEISVKNGDEFDHKQLCHEVSGDNFYIASDNDHWGHHYHLHVAEDFINELRSRN